MKTKHYKGKPKIVPEILNETGEKYWKLYCNYFLDRESLSEDLLPDIELIAFLQQKRVQIQTEIGDQNDPGLLDSLNKINRQLRMQKKNLKIYPRANQFNKPGQTDAEKQAEEQKKKDKSKMTLLNKTKNY